MRRKIFIFMLLSLLVFAAMDCSNGKAFVRISKVKDRLLSGKCIGNIAKYSTKFGHFVTYVKEIGKGSKEVCYDLGHNVAKRYKVVRRQAIPIADEKAILKAARVYRQQLNWRAQYVKADEVPIDKIQTQAFGKPKDATTLFKNMKKLGVSNEIPDQEQNIFKIIGVSPSHHIVGGRSEYANESRKIFETFKIDINDGRNGIVLPNNILNFARGTKHSGSHSEEYEKYVYEQIKNCKSEQEIWKEIDKIKGGLFNGTVQLNNNHQVID